jgi:hypothetical protein
MYVLGVFDDPNKDLAHIKVEKAHFQKIMGKLLRGEDFKYETFEGNSLDSLMNKIDEIQDILTWFHFSGHHDKGGIQLNDGNFSSLVDHLKNCKNLKGVFINGCASESTLDKLKDVVPICIGTYKPVNDGIATKFSEKFYRKMADISNWNDYGKIHQAFELTKTQIKDLLSSNDSIDGIDFIVRGGGSSEEIELEDNFYFITNKDEKAKKKFESINVEGDPATYVNNINEHLTKELIHVLSDQDGPKRFLRNLSISERDNWEKRPDSLKMAQSLLEDNFIWVIGSQLSRLFAIGHYKPDVTIETRIEEYIEICFITYRISLQLINYLFISKLWDTKRKNPEIDTDKELLRAFFDAKRKLKLDELRKLFVLMLEIFDENNIEYPIDKVSLGDLKEFSDSKSKFNQATAELERLESMVDPKKIYTPNHLVSAEKSLSVILSALKFFTKCKLMTIKKIEYEESRYSKIRYIKDITVLGGKENEDNTNYLKIDEKPEKTYSVMFIQPFMNGNKLEYKKVNMFPFLLDFNALINEESFDLIFYEFWDGESGLDYFSIKSEKDRMIHYKKVEDKVLDRSITKKVRKNRMKKIRLNLVTKQFEAAINTFLPGDFEVTNMPLVNDDNEKAIIDIF